MTTNPLKYIYDNQLKIKELEKQIKALEAENQKCLEKALLKKETDSGKYHLVTKVSTRRVPISGKVIEKLGNEKALEIATFAVKDLQKLFGEDDVTEMCKVTESIKRVVEVDE